MKEFPITPITYIKKYIFGIGLVLRKAVSFMLYGAVFAGVLGSIPAPVFASHSGPIINVWDQSPGPRVLTTFGFGSDDRGSEFVVTLCELNVDGSVDTTGCIAVQSAPACNGRGSSNRTAVCGGFDLITGWAWHAAGSTDGGTQCSDAGNPALACHYQRSQRLDTNTNLRVPGSESDFPDGTFFTNGTCTDRGYTSGMLQNTVITGADPPWMVANQLYMSIGDDASFGSLSLWCSTPSPIPAPILEVDTANPQGICPANNTVTVRLQWDDRQASQYTVIWYDAGDVEVGRTPDDSISGAVMTYDVTGLSRSTLYKFEVQARYNGQAVDSRGFRTSNRISVTTNACISFVTHLECVSNVCTAVPNTAGICANQNSCMTPGASCGGAMQLTLNKTIYNAGETPTYTISGAPPNTDVLWSSWKDGVSTGEVDAFYGHTTNALGNLPGVAGYAWAPRNAGSWVKSARVGSRQADATFSVISSVSGQKCDSLNDLDVICLDRGNSYILDGTITYGSGLGERPKMGIGAPGLGYLPISYPFGCNAQGERNSVETRNIANEKICEVSFTNANTEPISGIGIYTITVNTDAPEGDYPFGLVSSPGSTVTEPDFYIRIQALPPPACNAYAFSGGSVSPVSVAQDDIFTLSCDYGQADIGCIFPSTNAGSCSFTGFAGTAATFSCAASNTPATYAAACVMGGGTASNCCARIGDSAGSVTIHTVTAPLSGDCGDRARIYSASEPCWGSFASYCRAGTHSGAPSSCPASGSSASWTCLGANGGTDVPCSVSVSVVPIPHPFIAGSTAPSSVIQNDSFTVSCDYGADIDCINASSSAGACAFSNFTGTVANFSCAATNAPGVYANTCSTRVGTASNCQARTGDNAGNVTVIASPLVGANYHSTTENFINPPGPFLRLYNDPAVRSEVVSQLQQMADAGANIIKTHLWITRDPVFDAKFPTRKDEPWILSFPLSVQELSNIEQYTMDVASIRAADGHFLDLRFALGWQGCAAYTMENSDGTFGHCDLSWQTLTDGAGITASNLLSRVGPITRSDGQKVVKLVYFDSEVMIGAKANEDRFLRDLYPSFVSQSNTAGITPSVYFLAGGEESAILNDSFIDPEFPAINGHGSLFWVYRSTEFMRTNGLPIPNRLDFSLYPCPGSVTPCAETAVSYTTLISRVFDDIRAVYGSKLSGVAETFYFPNQVQRTRLGQAFANEFRTHGTPTEVIFWTTPDGGGTGIGVAPPFDFAAYK